MHQNEPIKKVKKSACGLDLETVLARIEAALGPAQRQWYINLDNATKHYSAPRLFFSNVYGGSMMETYPTPGPKKQREHPHVSSLSICFAPKACPQQV